MNVEDFRKAIAPRIEAGIYQTLDPHFGADWPFRIDEEHLDLSSATSCMLGQLGQHFDRAIIDIWNGMVTKENGDINWDIAVPLTSYQGFYIPSEDSRLYEGMTYTLESGHVVDGWYAAYRILTEMWKDRVLELRQERAHLNPELQTVEVG